jgi:pimeloyl-ACP methyl ester carboxylesterase
MSVRAGIRTWNIKKLVKFAGKALIASFLSTTLFQDAFFPPTRISTAQLMQKYFLPSAISRYEKIPLPKRGETLGVHFLKCQLKEEGPVRFQALHCNHGFGASCLSWLPTLPSLMDRLGARVALAHDAPGFGFTDRSDNITTYTRGTSAEIGTQLLQSALGGDHKSTSVALFGHSMGAAATLRMALALPKETRRFIVLVGPALGLIHEPVKVKSRLRSYTRPARQFVRRYLFDPTVGYVLRRTVGYVSCDVIVFFDII